MNQFEVHMHQIWLVSIDRIEEFQVSQDIARLKAAPEMQFVSAEAKALWQETAAHSDRMRAILDFAEVWARLMQLDLAEGRKLAKIWESTLDEADTIGISGDGVQAATVMLVKTWLRGSELKKVCEGKG